MNPQRVILRIGLLTSALLAFAAWFVARPLPGSVPDPTRRAERPAQATTDNLEIPDSGIEIRAPLTWRDARLGAGRTIAEVLGEFGLEPASTHRLVRALGDELDPRRLRPETGFRAGFDEGGTLVRLAIRDRADRFLRIEDASTEAPSVETVPLPVVTSVAHAGGRIETSVAQALTVEAGHSALVRAYADVFQWDVDLLVDPRPGDEVRVAYETRRLGEVPEDLPGFGRAPTRPGEFLGVGRILAASYDGRVARSEAFWVADVEDSGGYFDRGGRALQKTFLRSPLNYRRISSGFSRARRHPVTRKVTPHHGVDFAAAAGTPVVAAADGRVHFTGRQGPLGIAVRIRHGSEYETVYGHLSRIAEGIRSGASIRQNQVIGYVGATGRATGPHLHYTLIERGRPIDPMRFKNPEAAPLRADLRPALQRAIVTWSPRLAAIPIPTHIASRSSAAGGV